MPNSLAVPPVPQLQGYCMSRTGWFTYGFEALEGYDACADEVGWTAAEAASNLQCANLRNPAQTSQATKGVRFASEAAVVTFTGGGAVGRTLEG